MRCKYCSIFIPPVLTKSKRFSPMWRRMFKSGQKTRGFFRWILGEGRICFWYDTWLSDVPLVSFVGDGVAAQPQKVSDFWIGEHWDEEELWRLNEEWGVPAKIIEQIIQVPFDRGVLDRGRWAPTANGNFSVASAWDLVRNRAEKKEVHKLI